MFIHVVHGVKPDKYGQKYWLAVDKDCKYVVNGFPYVGRDETRSRDERVSDQVVMRLLKPYLKKGKNVTTDNYFYLNKFGHRIAKIQNQLTGNSKQNPQGSTCSGKAHERATLLHHAT